jgi:hypothetical protein
MFKLSSNAKQSLPMTELVSQVVVAWAASARTKDSPRGAFVLDGAPLADADLGDPTMLLPLVAWHADNLYKYGIVERGLGVSFHTDEEAMLGRLVNMDRVNRSAGEVLCFTVEALEDARSHLPKSAAVKGAVELRSLVNQFTAALGIAPAATADAGLTAAAVKPQA